MGPLKKVTHTASYCTSVLSWIAPLIFPAISSTKLIQEIFAEMNEPLLEGVAAMKSTCESDGRDLITISFSHYLPRQAPGRPEDVWDLRLDTLNILSCGCTSWEELFPEKRFLVDSMLPKARHVMLVFCVQNIPRSTLRTTKYPYKHKGEGVP